MDTDQARASFASLETSLSNPGSSGTSCTSQQTDNKHVRLDSVALVAVSSRDRQHHSP